MYSKKQHYKTARMSASPYHSPVCQSVPTFVSPDRQTEYSTAHLPRHPGNPFLSPRPEPTYTVNQRMTLFPELPNPVETTRNLPFESPPVKVESQHDLSQVVHRSTDLPGTQRNEEDTTSFAHSGGQHFGDSEVTTDDESPSDRRYASLVARRQIQLSDAPLYHSSASDTSTSTDEFSFTDELCADSNAPYFTIDGSKIVSNFRFISVEVSRDSSRQVMIERKTTTGEVYTEIVPFHRFNDTAHPLIFKSEHESKYGHGQIDSVDPNDGTIHYVIERMLEYDEDQDMVKVQWAKTEYPSIEWIPRVDLSDRFQDVNSIHEEIQKDTRN